MNTQSIGCFYVHSGVVLISDPCYSDFPHVQKTIENAATGKWNAHVVTEDRSPMWGRRVRTLIAKASDVHGEWTDLDGDIGVDSGQAGIWDRAAYPFNKDTERANKFYSHICDMTRGADAGCVEFGAVSSSGYGDGCYRVQTAHDGAGCVVAIQIHFITDEDEE